MVSVEKIEYRDDGETFEAFVAYDGTRKEGGPPFW